MKKKIFIPFLIIALLFTSCTTVLEDLSNVTITYSTDKGGTLDAKKIGVNKPLTENELPTLTEKGYVHKGWYLDGYLLAPGFVVTRNITLKAKWETQTYNIKYNLDGGKLAVGSPTTFTINDLPITLKEPTKDNSLFNGWYLTSDLSGQPITSIDKENLRDITLYAKWDQGGGSNYTVNYYHQNEDGKTYPSTATVTKTNQGRADTTPTIDSLKKLYTTPEGFTFDKNDTLTPIKADGSTVYNLYYSRNRYTIKFNGNTASGTAPSNIEKLYGVDIKLPKSDGLTKEGYAFDNWNTQQDGKGTSYSVDSLYKENKDTTFYAIWNKGAVNYKINIFLQKEDGKTYPKVEDIPTDLVITSSGITGSTPTEDELKQLYSATGYVYDKADPITPIKSDGSSVYNLYYSRERYSILFDANGGTGTAPSEIKKIYGVDATIPTETTLTKTGYTFAGWNTKSDGQGTKYEAGGKYVVNVPITLYAQWILGEADYKVNIFLQKEDGKNYNSVATETVKCKGKTNSTPTLDELQKKYTCTEGYTFDKNDTLSSISADGSTVYNLYYSRNRYSITFNGNTATGAVPNKIIKIYGVSTNLSDNGDLVKKGYSFKEWNTQKDGLGTGYKANQAFEQNTDITLYAIWSIVDYKITFKLNEGNFTNSYTAPISYNVENATTVVLPTNNDISKKDFIFEGWYKEGDTNQTLINNLSGLAENIVLCAKWTAMDTVASVTFSIPSGAIDKGKIELNTNTKNATIRYTIDGTNPTRDNGLTYDKVTQLDITDNVTVKAFAFKDGMIDSTVTSAEYTIKTYTVTFVTYNKGNTLENISGKYKNDEVNIPSIGQEVGYEFNGWFTTEQFHSNSQITSSAITITDDITLYAKWNPIEYSITYDLGVGNWEIPSGMPRKYTIENASSLALPTSEMMKPPVDYTFEGWYLSTDSTQTLITTLQEKSIGNVTLVAKWKQLEQVKPVTFSRPSGGVDKEDIIELHCETPNSVIYYAVNNRDINDFPTLYDYPYTVRGNLTINAYAVCDNMRRSEITTAKYTINKYKITFISDFVEPIVLEGEKNWHIPRDNYVENPGKGVDGYTFGGWFNNKEFSGLALDLQRYTIQGDDTFYAKWTPHKYSITFVNSYDSSWKTPNLEATYDQEVKLPPLSEAPTREGYDFIGWTEKQGETTVQYTAGQTVKNLSKYDGGGKTLYAVWKEKPKPVLTVNFDLNGAKGITPNPIKITKDSQGSLTFPKLTKEGCVDNKYSWVVNYDKDFDKGYDRNKKNINGQDVLIYNSNEYTIMDFLGTADKEVTLYARMWKPLPPTITGLSEEIPGNTTNTLDTEITISSTEGKPQGGILYYVDTQSYTEEQLLKNQLNIENGVCKVLLKDLVDIKNFARKNIYLHMKVVSPEGVSSSPIEKSFWVLPTLTIVSDTNEFGNGYGTGKEVKFTVPYYLNASCSDRMNYETFLYQEHVIPKDNGIGDNCLYGIKLLDSRNRNMYSYGTDEITDDVTLKVVWENETEHAIRLFIEKFQNSLAGKQLHMLLHPNSNSNEQVALMMGPQSNPTASIKYKIIGKEAQIVLTGTNQSENIYFEVLETNSEHSVGRIKIHTDYYYHFHNNDIFDVFVVDNDPNIKVKMVKINDENLTPLGSDSSYDSNCYVLTDKTDEEYTTIWQKETLHNVLSGKSFYYQDGVSPTTIKEAKITNVTKDGVITCTLEGVTHTLTSEIISAKEIKLDQEFVMKIKFLDSVSSNPLFDANTQYWLVQNRNSKDELCIYIDTKDYNKFLIKTSGLTNITESDFNKQCNP